MARAKLSNTPSGSASDACSSFSPSSCYTYSVSRCTAFHIHVWTRQALTVFLARGAAAWGAAFFKNPWFVLDLAVVAVTIYVELNEEALEHLKIVNVLRLWRLGAFVFDLALVEHEYAEVKEKEEGEKMKKDK